MEEVCHLQCKICQKVFPKFDQRGFRNAGFTAHQNKCIEKEYLLDNPVSKKHTSSKQRPILPAPSIAVSSSTQIMPNTSYTTNITAVQKNVSIMHKHQFQQSYQTGDRHDEKDSYLMNTSQAGNLDISLSPSYEHSYSKTTNNEIFYPITCCRYCNPEFGLHQSSCSLLSQILHQQRPPM